jgi:hypothetical protein
MPQLRTRQEAPCSEVERAPISSGSTASHWRSRALSVSASTEPEQIRGGAAKSEQIAPTRTGIRPAPHSCTTTPGVAGLPPASRHVRAVSRVGCPSKGSLAIPQRSDTPRNREAQPWAQTCAEVNATGIVRLMIDQLRAAAEALTRVTRSLRLSDRQRERVAWRFARAPVVKAHSALSRRRRGP